MLHTFPGSTSATKIRENDASAIPRQLSSKIQTFMQPEVSYLSVLQRMKVRGNGLEMSMPLPRAMSQWLNVLSAAEIGLF